MPTTLLDVSHPAGRLGRLLFLGVVWGGAFLAFRIAAPEVGPVWAAEIRIVIGAALLLAIAGRRTVAIARHDLRALAVLGATFSAIPFTLLSVAALTLPTGLGAVLNATTPLFTATLGVLWLGQHFSHRLVAALVTGFVGVAIVVGWAPLEPSVETGLAVLLVLGAAMSYAVAGSFARRRLPHVGGMEMATGQLAAGGLILAPVALASGPIGAPSPAGIIALLAVGVFSTAIPWPIFHRLLAATTPTTASTVTFIVPAFAIVWGAIVLGEPIGPNLIVGFAAILVSLVLVVGLRLPISLRRTPRPAEVPTA
jgi:drug/metabolite transporter (DMT)-like permease